MITKVDSFEDLINAMRTGIYFLLSNRYRRNNLVISMPELMSKLFERQMYMRYMVYPNNFNNLGQYFEGIEISTMFPYHGRVIIWPKNNLWQQEHIVEILIDISPDEHKDIEEIKMIDNQKHLTQ